jgi:CRISPR-associated protein Cmr2
VNQSGWDDQKNGVIEFYSAWCPFKEDLSDYREARQKVARLLAARKNLRDFTSWQGKAGVPKSSLDGRRESVLKAHEAPQNIRGVRIKKGEALDVVGCVKRAAGGKVQFPSVTRVAVDPWIRGAGNEIANTNLAGCCEELVSLGALSRGDNDTFPYEGTALLPQRYSEFEEGFENPEAIRSVTEKMKRIMTELYHRHKPIAPYLTVLCADGDRMGQAISTLDTPDAHRKFSATLSKFAGDARGIVKKHYGNCVYTGGDDVLAFLPLDTAIDCARDLHDLFSGLWDKNSGKFSPTPTLSVGIAIGHALEDLEFLLQFGREAEKLAKAPSPSKDDERNGLAITIRARGNAEFSVREQWKDAANTKEQEPLANFSLDQRLTFWSHCFASGSIPSKFPYELRDSAKFYKEWEKGKNLDQAMQLDVLRIFNRKDLELGNKKALVATYIKSVVSESYKSIERLAEELLVAQWIGAARIAAGEEIDDKPDKDNNNAD